MLFNTKDHGEITIFEPYAAEIIGVSAIGVYIEDHQVAPPTLCLFWCQAYSYVLTKKLLT